MVVTVNGVVSVCLNNRVYYVRIVPVQRTPNRSKTFNVRSLIGCIFPIPRIMYAMSSDGLLFNFLSKINEKTKTPFTAAIICGVSAGEPPVHAIHYSLLCRYNNIMYIVCIQSDFLSMLTHFLTLYNVKI